MTPVDQAVFVDPFVRAVRVVRPSPSSSAAVLVLAFVPVPLVVAVRGLASRASCTVPSACRKGCGLFGGFSWRRVSETVGESGYSSG
jgi:hypothetical protein